MLCRCSAVAPQKHDSEENGWRYSYECSMLCLSVVTVLTSFGSHKLRWVLFFIFGRGAFLPGVAHWRYFLFFFPFVLLQQTRAECHVRFLPRGPTAVFRLMRRQGSSTVIHFRIMQYECNTFSSMFPISAQSSI